MPGVDLFEGNPGNKVNAQEAFGKGKHVIFAIPGAFTPTCQNVSTYACTLTICRLNS